MIIAIDGRSASGKTTFAKKLAKKYGAVLLQMDDFFLPLSKREEKLILGPAHMDLKRFEREVLRPFSQGKEIIYKPYNCARDKMCRARRFKPAKIAVVDGAYSFATPLLKYYDYKIFMTVSDEEQKKRLLKREGKEKLKVFNKFWIPAEENYFKKYEVRQKADIILDTTNAERG